MTPMKKMNTNLEVHLTFLHQRLTLPLNLQISMLMRSINHKKRIINLLKIITQQATQRVINPWLINIRQLQMKSTRHNKTTIKWRRSISLKKNIIQHKRSINQYKKKRSQIMILTYLKLMKTK